jgi:hypothetical protein
MFKRLLGWIEGEDRDYSKSWFQDRKDRRTDALEALGGRVGKLEAAELPEGVGAHRDNVWLALGSLAVVGGLGLLTAAWLGAIALAVRPEGTHPSVALEIMGWVILAGGLFGLFWAVRIFLFFFRGTPQLPLTLMEKRERARKSQGTASVQPKAQEGSTPGGAK